MISGTPPVLFGSVPDRDYLGFWQGRTLNPLAVARFLRFSRSDVARIALVSPLSVRYDHKMPADVLARLAQIAIVCGHVADHFDGDASKTAAWFMTGNPLLGDLAPRDMILRGRYEALRRIVMQGLEREAVADAKPGADAGPGDLPPLIIAHQAAISALCLRYGVRQLALGAPILRQEFDARPGAVAAGAVAAGAVDPGPMAADAVDPGDIDLVVEFGPPGQVSSAPQYGDFKRDLGQLLGRAVDLVELSAMQDCHLKRIIQRTRTRIYATAA
jgi:hypothetical protein